MGRRCKEAGPAQAKPRPFGLRLNPKGRDEAQVRPVSLFSCKAFGRERPLSADGGQGSAAAAQGWKIRSSPKAPTSPFFLQSKKKGLAPRPSGRGGGARGQKLTLTFSIGKSGVGFWMRKAVSSRMGAGRGSMNPPLFFLQSKKKQGWGIRSGPKAPQTPAMGGRFVGDAVYLAVRRSREPAASAGA